MQRQPIDWSPRRPRRPTSLTGRVRWPDGTSATVLITDISYDGCHVWCDRDFTCGETVSLTVPTRGNIEAQVRWAQDGEAGLRLLTGGSAADDRRARIGV